MNQHSNYNSLNPIQLIRRIIMEYAHLGIYSDLAVEARRQQTIFPLAQPGVLTVQQARHALGFCDQPEIPLQVQVEDRWERDGLAGEYLSWWVGYGPRTHAWLLKPANDRSALPAVLALHDHGGYKYYGKEKIADGPQAANSAQQAWFMSAYGGRAWANALAKRGFVVLVPDAFLWGSRKFPLETIEKAVSLGFPGEDLFRQNHGAMDEIAYYNFYAGHHEHLVAKYCNLLGTCLAGVVAHEDRIALNYLLTRPDVESGKLGCLGLSGGGNRAVLLRATAEPLKAVGVVGLMTTYPELLDHNITTHTWMFFPSNWSRYGDWPDLAACRAPAPLLVQYDTEDELFTLKGMQDAHARLSAHYAQYPQAYCGQFYPGLHKFDVEMQEAAFDWLQNWLG
jgi:dienelactone hydrolase